MKRDTKAEEKPKKSFAVLCIAAAVVGVAAAWLCWRDRLIAPPAPPQALPTIAPADFEKVKEQVRLVGRTLLGVTPEQEKQIDAIWRRPPATLNELVEFTRRSDAVLTETQRAIAKPIRRAARNQVIDRILEPARSRFPPEDFERLKTAIKTRVDARVDGPGP
ncbi:MAG: hypothetical protein N3D11_17975 [Candidatus Sumerlaeia bacterium]|nr:hypothetical protein [Candidatus Sumerlaeia bacterium]